MSKEALVARLITAERTLAEQREQWLSQQDEMLTRQPRAGTAEMNVKPLSVQTARQKTEWGVFNLW